MEDWKIEPRGFVRIEWQGQGHDRGHGVCVGFDNWFNIDEKCDFLCIDLIDKTWRIKNDFFCEINLMKAKTLSTLSAGE